MTDGKAWLKPEQVERIRDACHAKRARNRDRNEAIVALMYDTGLRPGETCGLTVPMFDADDGVLRLTSEVQKDYPNDNTPPACTIELAQDRFTSDTVRTVTRHLNGRDDDSLFLFASAQSDALTTRSLRRLIKSLAERADVKPYIGQAERGEPSDLHPHSLRHSLAYRMLRARDDGTTLYDVTNRLRHRSVATTEQVYSHFDSV